MIKLIASDIDGTLLKNHSQILPERTAGLIRALIDSGISFVAASGRQHGNLRRMFEPVSDQVYYVAENGCICTWRDQTIAKMQLPQETAMDIIDAIRAFPSCYAMASGADTCYIETGDPRIASLIRDDLEYTVTRVGDLKRDIPEPILKIAVCDLQGTDRIGPHFARLFHGTIKAVTAGQLWVDFVSDTANKGLGLKAVLDYLHIDPSECVAFGDQHNDEDMLRLAGTSYLMSSAAPGMEQYADHIIDSVDDVLEEILRSAGKQKP